MAGVLRWAEWPAECWMGFQLFRRAPVLVVLFLAIFTWTAALAADQKALVGGRLIDGLLVVGQVVGFREEASCQKISC